MPKITAVYWKDNELKSVPIEDTDLVFIRVKHKHEMFTVSPGHSLTIRTTESDIVVRPVRRTEIRIDSLQHERNDMPSNEAIETRRSIHALDKT